MTTEFESLSISKEKITIGRHLTRINPKVDPIVKTIFGSQ